MKKTKIILRVLFGMILALGLLIFLFLEKTYCLLMIVFVFCLLVFVFRKKSKEMIFWLTKTIFIGLSGLVLTLVLLFFVGNLWDIWRIQSYVPEGKPMRIVESPSSRFTIAVYPSPTIMQWPFSFPGQGGDGPAMFILRDNQTDKVLQSHHFSSFWYMHITDVEWYDDHVTLSRADDKICWSLPPNESAK